MHTPPRILEETPGLEPRAIVERSGFHDTGTAKLGRQFG
jgi:hypothetical protein